MKKIGIHDPVLTAADHARVEACLRSNWISARGAEVQSFEAAIQEFFRAPARPLATVNGSAALVLALRVAGVGAGDHVLCSDYGFVATANAARRVGAEPILIGPEDPAFPVITREQIERFFAEEVRAGNYRATNRPVRAVLYNEPYGLAPRGFRELAGFLDGHGIPLIEDSSQGFGRIWEGKPLGAFGSLGVFSLNGNKTLTTGAGGILLGRADWLEHARRLSSQARSDGFDFFYDELAYNFDLSNLLAALGRAQLERMDATLARKASIRKKYRECLGPHFRLLDGESDYPAWLNVALTEKPLSRDSLRTLAARLLDRGIQIRPAFPPVSRNEHYRSAHVHSGENSAYLFHHGICLPSGAGLGDEDVARVAELFVREGKALGLG